MMMLPNLTNPEIARYSRHLILGQFGIKSQRRLKAASVLCVGTGGLGSPLLMYLAAAGVGRIGIVDFDVVDTSNLHRQIIHGTSSLGKPKVQSAVERIADINPFVQVDVHEEFLIADNALRIAEGYDVIVDGTDNFPTRYLVNDVCEILGKPNVYGSVFGFEGQASVFNYQGGPTYRDLYPEPPPPGMVPSCAEGGILGVLPGLIGLVQATETIKILIGLGKVLSGRVLLYDATDMRFREIKLNKRANAKPITELVDYQIFCGISPGDQQSEESIAARGYTGISALDTQQRLANGWKPYVLDMREVFETEIVSLACTDQVCAPENLKRIIEHLPRDRDLLLYCRTGSRSAEACRTLAATGLKRLFNLKGGITQWAKDVDQSLPIY